MYSNSDKSDTTFTVYFSAKVRESYTIATAAKHFISAFKVSPEKMRALLIRVEEKGPVALRSKISHEEARNLANKIEKCGFACTPSIDDISIDMGASIYEEIERKEKYKTPKVIEFWVTCHGCFLRQDDENERCTDCGIALHK